VGLERSTIRVEGVALLEGFCMRGAYAGVFASVGYRDVRLCLYRHVLSCLPCMYILSGARLR
jgi:hypothetical protein